MGRKHLEDITNATALTFLAREKKPNRHKTSAMLAIEWYHPFLLSEPCCGKES